MEKSMSYSNKNRVRKERIDKGKKRNKYDKSLPLKYISYLKRANRKQIDMNLTVKQFNDLLSQPCEYCGSIENQTIDRIDSSKGYVIDNCTTACNICNLMKFTYSREQFISHINRIANYKAIL